MFTKTPVNKILIIAPPKEKEGQTMQNHRSLNTFRISLKLTTVALVLISCSGSFICGSEIVMWGDNDYGNLIPPAGNDYVAIAAGYSSQSLALKSDGSIVGWGGIPLAPVPLQNIQRYYGTLRPCASHWYSGTYGCNHLCGSLDIEATGSHVPYKTLLSGHAILYAECRLSRTQVTPRLVTGQK